MQYTGPLKEMNQVSTQGTKRSHSDKQPQVPNKAARLETITNGNGVRLSNQANAPGSGYVRLQINGQDLVPSTSNDNSGHRIGHGHLDDLEELNKRRDICFGNFDDVVKQFRDIYPRAQGEEGTKKGEIASTDLTG